VPLTACDEFLDYKGKAGDWQEAFEAIKAKFLEKNQNKERRIYVHMTCTIDTEQVKVIFEAVKHGIVTRAFEDAFGARATAAAAAT